MVVLCCKNWFLSQKFCFGWTLDLDGCFCKHRYQYSLRKMAYDKVFRLLLLKFMDYSWVIPKIKIDYVFIHLIIKNIKSYNTKERIFPSFVESGSNIVYKLDFAESLRPNIWPWWILHVTIDCQLSCKKFFLKNYSI